MSQFLERVRIERYGAMVNRTVGPFRDGLNVVFGPNEAGKSTIASFIGGVLFGWEEAHGVRNTYSVADGGRAGQLEFSEGLTLGRAHNADGLTGDTQLVSDIDNATYKTMFSLTSDELRTLQNSSDVMARLLTAGSGTSTSPAGAYVAIEQRIAELTSRTSGEEPSIVVLGDRLDDIRSSIKEQADAAEQHRREDAELRNLKEDYHAQAGHLAQLNSDFDQLTTCRTKVERIDGLLEAQQQELDVLRSELREAQGSCDQGAAVDPRLLALDAASERSLRDRLDEYADELAKATRGVDIARENAESSAAAFEALVEMDDDAKAAPPAWRIKLAQAAIPTLLALAFVAAGVPVFMHGRAIASLSFTALGIGLFVFAVLLATAAIGMIVRPDRSSEATDSRRKDAQWVMLQDRKKLDTNLTAKSLIDHDIETFLADAGLAGANGSIRQARALLDDARDERTRIEADRQKIASLALRIDTLETSIEELSVQRRALTGKLEFDDEVALEDIDKTLALKSSQRDALSAAIGETDRRIGELGERLDQARKDRTLDYLKIEYQQTRVRLRDAKHELATLLLAKRMLDKSIAAWESRSQPEVYHEASKLLATTTNGAWTQISMTTEGRLIASGADGTAREVRHLSLGTCQQLYLSLRIAMLFHAENVGRSIPVLADDILVNFDAERRRGAARILAELARKRQLIVFTCHQETVSALREISPDLNYLEL